MGGEAFWYPCLLTLPQQSEVFDRLGRGYVATPHAMRNRESKLKPEVVADYAKLPITSPEKMCTWLTLSHSLNPFYVVSAITIDVVASYNPLKNEFNSENSRYSASFTLFDFGAAGALVGELTICKFGVFELLTAPSRIPSG